MSHFFDEIKILLSLFWRTGYKSSVLHIYSSATKSFLLRVKATAWDILQNELGLEVQRTRFLWHGFQIPINFIVFEDNEKIGLFEKENYTIGINKKLMYLAKNELLKNVIRHELLHLFTFLETKNSFRIHGPQFRSIAQSLGWDKEVYLAKVNLELANEEIQGDLKSEKVLATVKKLMALANSSNQHESEQATIKANQLLIKHNLQYVVEAQEDEEVVVKRVLTGKRINGKHQAILKILRTFFIYPIFNKFTGGFYLEVIGSRVNVELADYIATYLDRELESIWQNAQKGHPELTGLADKNTFMYGMGVGFTQKIQAVQKTTTDSKSLIQLQNKTLKQVGVVYPRLSTMRSKMHLSDGNAFSLGKDAGIKLQINSALSAAKNTPTYLLD